MSIQQTWREANETDRQSLGHRHHALLYVYMVAKDPELLEADRGVLQLAFHTLHIAPTRGHRRPRDRPMSGYAIHHWCGWPTPQSGS